MKRLRRLLHHPTTNLMLALILVGTSLAEVWESLTGDAVRMALGRMEMPVGAYDGVLILGIVHLLRAVAELLGDVEHSVERSATGNNGMQ